MEHIDVVKKLIGPIRPVGETNADDERFENLKEMCELTKALLMEIDAVACSRPFDKQYSIRRNCDFGIDFLEEVGYRKKDVEQ